MVFETKVESSDEVKYESRKTLTEAWHNPLPMEFKTTNEDNRANNTTDYRAGQYFRSSQTAMTQIATKLR